MFRIADGIADVNGRNTRDRHDGADGGVHDLGFLQSRKFIEPGNLDPFPFFRQMGIGEHYLVPYGKGAVFNFADICVCTGVGLLFLHVLLEALAERRAAAPEGGQDAGV